MQMGDCVEGVEHRASKASNGGPHCPSNKHTGHPPRKPRATGDAVCPHGGREVKEPSGAYENKNEYFLLIQGNYCIRLLMVFRENSVKCIKLSVNMEVLLVITFLQCTFKN